MADEIQELAEQLHLREMLESGRARRIVVAAGLTNADVARAIGVSAPTVWTWFNAGRRPRRAAALRLVRLLVALEGALDV